MAHEDENEESLSPLPSDAPFEDHSENPDDGGNGGGGSGSSDRFDEDTGAIIIPSSNASNNGRVSDDEEYEEKGISYGGGGGSSTTTSSSRNYDIAYLKDDHDWKSVGEDPSTTVGDLIPHLLSYKEKIHRAESDLKAARQHLNSAKHNHRGSIVSLHNKMFKKLLDAEESHESDLEESRRRNAQLERNLRKYEQAMGGESTSIKELIEKEEAYEERINELEKENKELSEQLKIASLKTETADRSRRQSIATLHNRMFKKLLDAEAESEKKCGSLMERIQELEMELKRSKMENEQIENSRRQSISTLHNNMFQQLLDAEAEHEQVVNTLKNQIKDLSHELSLSKLENSFLSPDPDKIVENMDEFNDSSVDELKEQLSRVIRERDALQQRFDLISQKYQSKADPDSLKKKSSNEEDSKDAHDDDGQEENDDGNPLHVQIRNLKAQLAQKESALLGARQENTEIETNRRQSISFLSNQMMERLLEAEEQHTNDQDAWNLKEKEMQSQINQLEKDLSNQKRLNHILDSNRRNSVATNSAQMFQKLLALEEDKAAMQDEYDEKIQELEDEIAKLRLDSEDAEKRRRGSITDLHQSMFQKLLDAEEQHNLEVKEWQARCIELEAKVTSTERTRSQSIAQYENDMFKHLMDAQADAEAMETRLKAQISDLEGQMNGLKRDNSKLVQTLEFAEASKLNLLTVMNRQMEDLRMAVKVMNQM